MLIPPHTEQCFIDCQSGITPTHHDSITIAFACRCHKLTTFYHQLPAVSEIHRFGCDSAATQRWKFRLFHIFPASNLSSTFILWLCGANFLKTVVVPFIHIASTTVTQFFTSTMKLIVEVIKNMKIRFEVSHYCSPIFTRFSILLAVQHWLCNGTAFLSTLLD